MKKIRNLEDIKGLKKDDLIGLENFTRLISFWEPGIVVKKVLMDSRCIL
ncbi:MAG: hypothetical protein ABIB79_05345 [archaeon]